MPLWSLQPWTFLVPNQPRVFCPPLTPFQPGLKRAWWRIILKELKNWGYVLRCFLCSPASSLASSKMSEVFLVGVGGLCIFTMFVSNLVTERFVAQTAERIQFCFILWTPHNETQLLCSVLSLYLPLGSDPSFLKLVTEEPNRNSLGF